mmetsp:Transcript_26337/g.42218  ORF Transcript_26337/g.42218 Transcript_26337/m.42218 type:complete len:114 (+) Transcript_26337:2162-2503(+)
MAAPGFSTPSQSAARIYGGSVTVTRAIFGSLRWETKWFVGSVLDLDLLFFDGGCTPTTIQHRSNCSPVSVRVAVSHRTPPQLFTGYTVRLLTRVAQETLIESTVAGDGWSHKR